jgi:Concanavalin A-like lectin/glucanases superfamily/Domain of unknown function (DUF2341)
MGTMIRILSLLLALSTSSLWLSCSPAKSIAAGGTGSETVIGRALTPSGQPAANAIVHLRRAGYVSFLATAPKGTTEDYADDTTNSGGYFALPGIQAGSYRVEVNDGISNAILFDCTVDGRADTADVGTGTLQPYAVVNVSVVASSRGNSGLLVQVRGLERLVEIAADGKITVANLPPCMLDVRVISADSSIAPFETEGVTAADGVAANVTMDPNWRFAKRLYINTTASGANVNETVVDFPLLVRLDSANFIFSQASGSGQDIRFAKADLTPLPYQIEEFNSQGKSATIWVRADTVYGNTGAQFITILWGNPSASSQSDGAAVFDTANGFAGVWHLGDAAGAVRADATANHADAKPVGYDGDEQVRGCIAGGDSLDNNNDALDAGNFAVAGSLTMSMWINTAAYKPWGHLIAKAYDPAVYPWLAYGLQLDSTDTPHVSMTVTTQNGDSSIETISRVPLQQWVYVTGTFDGSSLRLYFNGAKETDVPFSGAIVQNSKDVYIGELETSPEQRFCGKIDEVRISTVARGAGWVKLCYETQKQNSAVLVFPK